MLSLLITIVLYLPVFIVSGYSFSFLTHYDPGFDFSGYMGRVLYYNIAIFGGFLVVLALLVTAPYQAFYQYLKQGKNLFIFSFIITAIIIVEVLFVHLPYEREFLLPLVLLVVPLYLFFSRSLVPAYILLSFTILSNIINIDIVDIEYSTLPNGDVKAENAHVRIVAKPGFVVRDIEAREDSAKRYIKQFLHIAKPESEVNKPEYLSRSVFK
jgi:hypothetical protein